MEKDEIIKNTTPIISNMKLELESINKISGQEKIRFILNDSLKKADEVVIN